MIIWSDRSTFEYKDVTMDTKTDSWFGFSLILGSVYIYTWFNTIKEIFYQCVQTGICSCWRNASKKRIKVNYNRRSSRTLQGNIKLFLSDKKKYTSLRKKGNALESTKSSVEEKP